MQRSEAWNFQNKVIMVELQVLYSHFPCSAYKSLQSPLKMPGFCDLKQREDKLLQNHFHL